MLRENFKSPVLFIVLLVCVFAAETLIFYYTDVTPSMKPAAVEKKVHIKLSSVTPTPPKPVCDCQQKPEPRVEKPKPKPRPKPKPVVKPKPKPKPKPVPKPKVAEKKTVPKPPEPVPPKPIVPAPVKRVQKAEARPAAKPLVSAQNVDTEKMDKIKADYLKEVREEIERSKYYPRSARKLRQTGIVEVEFVILKDGSIEKITVVSPCRHRRLNRAAVKTVEKIGRFKPLPDAFKRSDLVLKVPISYTLNSR